MKHKTFAAATGLLLAASIFLQPAYAEQYGPIKSNETLWDIAKHYSSSQGVSTAKMMQAFRAENPHAFIAGHPGMLKKGIYLKVPALGGVVKQAEAAPVADKPAAVTDSQPSAETTVNMASLQGEIDKLRNQLKKEQEKSASMAVQIKALQGQSKQSGKAGQQQVSTLQSELLIKLQTDLADLKQQLQQKDARIVELQAISKQSNAKNSKAMQAELADLKALLEQRDTHIQNLQAALREASISIKRQFAENQALHAQLKAEQPDAGLTAPQPPAEPGSGTPSSLTLAGAEAAGQTAETPPAASASTPVVFADQIALATQEPTETDKKPVSLQNMLQQQATDNGSANQDDGFPMPSRVSVVIALISLMFVLALAWRAFSQQRALREEEARLRAALGSEAV